jgi:transglutaminase-like putative cysteine protease
MAKYLKYFSVLILALLSSCTEKHLINDDRYLQETIRAFNERKVLASNRESQLFQVFDDKLTTEEKEALQFLFAYMPLNDLADYDGKFFLSNAKKALQSRSAAPWRNDIPENIFLHYILPPRINNENLDSFRLVYYDEIHERIKGLNIREAALELNHWCQEKVAYQGADIRTSAPMSTVLSARGRCGEESTFTVAALRTAGIPARQVYTPRWAHNDDNHAWVEVWIEGKWYYMGACEPEPIFDRGWFTEPARRAMLVHTRSFGASYGQENVINHDRNFSEVNNLSKYAVTKKIYVKVLDAEGKPEKNAKVEFQLYNYAEFYPLTTVPVDDNGISSLETGLGDLLIWAYSGDDFSFRKISVSSTDTLVLKLDSLVPEQMELDLAVPPVLPAYQGPSADLERKNSERISKGNIIRQNYINSWPGHKDAVEFAASLKTDTFIIPEILSRSMGNYAEIKKFLSNTPEDQLIKAVHLLQILSDKDLRDIKEYILADHLRNSGDPGLITKENEAIYLQYILNPRIANEMIVPWRRLLRNGISNDSAIMAVDDPENIVRMINAGITIEDSENYYKTPITPRGVHELKVSDQQSRAIYFVAICRSIGIPSRLEPARGVPQYYQSGKWVDVYFKDQQRPSVARSYLKLTTNSEDPVPSYYIQFTVARFENGKYHTLEYDFNKKVTDFGELEMIPGKYMLVTGKRLNDGRVLSGLTFFELKENEHKTLAVNPRKELQETISLGKIAADKIISLFPGSAAIKENAGKNGIVMLWIEPDQEPTRHIFNDLPVLKEAFDKWDGYFLFMTTTGQSASTFKPGDVKGLPAKSLFSSDNQLKKLNESLVMSPLPDIRLPFILVADKNSDVVFTSTGYRIGIGDQIIKYLK